MSESTTIEITPALARQDGQNRIAKTAGQAGGATALTVLGQYVAMQAGLISDQLPTEVFGAIVTLLTIIAAWVTNLRLLRGET